MANNSVKLHARNETDRDILCFVREFEDIAPVTAESIHSYLELQRKRQITLTETQDRLNYLVSAKYLELITEWQAGEFRHYKITADGMDLLDGAIPPRNWKK